jgi:hypothetical protein
MTVRLQITAFPVLLGASVALAMCGCHSAAEPAPPPAPIGSVGPPASPADAEAQHAEFGAHRSPVVVRMSGPADVQAGQDIELVAEVEQFVGAKSTVSLDLALPPGARLVSGNPSEQLPPGNGTITRRFVVHLDVVPKTDVELVARTGNVSFGARATGTYRFGRPTPAFVQPKRSADELIVGGRSLGHPIELKPTSTTP